MVGYVAQAWSLCKPKYMIQDINENTQLRIKGPICQWNICGDVEFDVSMSQFKKTNKKTPELLLSYCFIYVISIFIFIPNIPKHTHIQILINIYVDRWMDGWMDGWMDV